MPVAGEGGEQGGGGDVAHYLACCEAGDEGVFGDGRAEGLGDLGDGREVARQDEEAYEGCQQPPIHACKGLSVKEHKRRRDYRQQHPAGDGAGHAQQAESKAKAAFLAVPVTDRKAQAAALDAWRNTRKAVEDAKSAPAAVAVLDEAPVKQLDFESIAAGLLA